MAFVAPVLGFMPKYHNSFIHSRGVSCSHEPQCHSGRLPEEARGTVSRVICSLAPEIVSWSELHSVT